MKNGKSKETNNIGNYNLPRPCFSSGFFCSPYCVPKFVDSNMKWWIIFILVFPIWLLTLFICVASVGVGYGNVESEVWASIIMALFNVLTFPTMLFEDFFPNLSLALLALFINSLLYSILIERFIWLMKYLRRRKARNDLPSAF